MTGPAAGDGPVVDLGGCEGCGLGCALTCAAPAPARADEARRVLVATGAGVVLLAAAPALLPLGWLRLLAGVVGASGAVISVLAGVARRAGRPRGDACARWAYRLVPAAMAGTMVLWLLVVVREALS